MANSYLYRTNGTPTSAYKGTVSHWIKRSIVGVSEGSYGTFGVFNNGGSATDRGHLNIYNDTIYFYNQQTSTVLQTNRKFRDTNGWYHIVIAWDTTQATASNRVKIYVNGVQETSFSTATYPGQNNTMEFNVSGRRFAVGALGSNGNAAYFWDGYQSHFAFVDGLQLTPTSFGETDSTSGIWKFKSPSGITWGNNGFHLKFENSGALGTDSSGNGNNLTVSGNLTQSKDTPSNNFCTLNPNLPIPSGFTITNGNLSFACGTTQWQGNVSSLAPTKGKWYYECQYTTGSGIKLDIVRQDPDMRNMATNNQSYGAYHGNGYGYQLNNSGTDYYCSNNTCTTWNSSRGNSTKIYMVCIDLDNGKYWIGADGTWFNKTGTANPATGTDPLHSFSGILNGDPFFITLSAEGTGSTHHANFGSGFYGTTAVSTNSGNGYSDANSEGKFSYQPPSGYYALNTKNLNTYG